MLAEQTEAAGDSLRNFVQILRRRWWVILACLIVVPAAAFAFSRAQPRRYTATANLVLADPSVAAGIAGTQGAPAAGEQATNLNTALGLAVLKPVADATARALGGVYASRGVPGSVAINNDGTSNIITVTATEANPELAARVANTYASQYISFRTGANVAQVKRELADIRAQLRQSLSAAPAAFLRQRETQLSTLASLQNGNAQLVAPATPPGAPSSPKTTLIVLAGAALGLMLGILFAVLFAALDRRLRDPGDVQAVLDGPILGAIPRSKSVVAANDGTVLHGVDLESFSMIYANMSNYHDQPIRSVLVTSAHAGDGKSTLAWNLATTGAVAGVNVLLIEADLRRPTIATRLGAEPKAGLRDLLRGEGTLTEVVCPVTLTEPASKSSRNGDHGNGPRTNGDQPVTVGVLFAGPDDGVSGSLVDRPSSLLASDRMRDLITEAESLYDLVVIDTPPTSLVSDAIPLVKHVSGVIVVTRVRKNTREAASQLRDQLQNLRARTLGVVVNDVGSVDGYYRSVASYIGS